MVTFKYAVDLDKMGLDEPAKEQVRASGQKTIFENMCNQALVARYKEGIGGGVQRAYARVLHKLDTSKDESIELDSSELDLLKEIFGAENTRFHPTQTRLVGAYLDSLEKAG